jgi:hypothetical protein
MEHRMNAAMQANLVLLKAQPKFVDEPGTIYNGMRPEGLRRAAEDRLNHLIEGLMRDLPSGLSTRAIRSRFAATLSSFPGHDTEDRERMCQYIEHLADILEIEKPRGLLTRWLYGPILGTLLLLPTRRQKPSEETT